jgi:hypothetical protein
MAQYRNPYIDEVCRQAGIPVPEIHPYPSYAYSARDLARQKRDADRRANEARRASRAQGSFMNAFIGGALAFFSVQFIARPQEAESIFASMGVDDTRAASLAVTSGGVLGIVLVLVAGIVLIRALRSPKKTGQSRRPALMMALALVIGVGAGVATLNGLPVPGSGAAG